MILPAVVSGRKLSQLPVLPSTAVPSPGPAPGPSPVLAPATAQAALSSLPLGEKIAHSPALMSPQCNPQCIGTKWIDIDPVVTFGFLPKARKAESLLTRDYMSACPSLAPLKSFCATPCHSRDLFCVRVLHLTWLSKKLTKLSGSTSMLR